MDNVQTDADEADDGSHEWDGSSPAICRACGYTGTVDDFDNDEATIAAIERKEAGLTEEVE
jgi:hypothetical protein